MKNWNKTDVPGKAKTQMTKNVAGKSILLELITLKIIYAY